MLDIHNVEYPGPLQTEPNPPNAAQIVAAIKEWVIWQLRCTITSNVHYENQLYGVWNGYLEEMFPTARRFSIHPQYILRRAITGDEVDNYPADADTSFGSTGAAHESRNLVGKESETENPDFIATKQFVQDDGSRAHRLLAIVEIKRNEVGVRRGHYQMVDYMRRAMDHPNRPAELRGYLIGGQHLKRYWIRSQDTNVVEYDEKIYDISVHPALPDGYNFALELGGISSAQWNEETPTSN